MNIAIIFAGGTGQRMHNASIPKQFMTINNKPIIIYTLEVFEKSNQIDAIIVVCLKDWIEKCREYIRDFHISKVASVIPGGETGFLSRKNGVDEAAKQYPGDTIVLIHDGVRPLINSATISDNIATVKKYGSSITVSPAIETIAVKTENGNVGTILDRALCEMVKAPQCFYLKDLYDAHNKACEAGMIDCIDTAFLMQKYGYNLHTVPGPDNNIKITTPVDYYMFKAMIEMSAEES